jgi:hypothetical protein
MPDPPAPGPPFRADDLTFLRKQAKALLRAARERNPAADVPSQMKFFGCDGVNIVLFKSDKISRNSCIYFRVPGEEGLLEKKLDMLKAKGVKVESDAHVIARNWKGCNVWMAFFRDPFGNLLAMKSDVPVK